MRFQTNFEKVKEFHEVFGVEVSAPITEKLAHFRDDLIWEEYQEVCRELMPNDYRKKDYIEFDEWAKTVTIKSRFDPTEVDKVKLTKELADLLYVVYGTGVTFGLPLDEAFDLVHQSNLSKLENGEVLRREDGKVLKGKNYKPADLSVLFKDKFDYAKNHLIEDIKLD